jgi:hypothetical protein
MQAVLPRDWGAAIATAANTITKAENQSSLATVVAGHVLQFVGEGVPAVNPTMAAKKAAPRLARAKVAPTPPLAAKRAVRPAVSAPARRAAQPMAKAMTPAAPITNAAPELMFKSFSALDRAAQLDAELRERLAHPGKFL